MVAEEGCEPDATLNAVQHCEDSTHAGDKSNMLVGSVPVEYCWQDAGLKESLLDLHLANTTQQGPQVRSQVSVLTKHLSTEVDTAVTQSILLDPGYLVEQ